jgi:hypothetical protein
MKATIPIFEIIEANANFLLRFPRVTKDTSALDEFFFEVADRTLKLAYCTNKNRKYLYIFSNIKPEVLEKIKKKRVIKVEEQHKVISFDLIAINTKTYKSEVLG